MKELIDKQILQLDLSESLKTIFRENGFIFLRELLDREPEELMDISGLTIKDIFEYKKFLIENSLQGQQKGF
ncbi:hypothetical protein [Pedobacter paludis]|uniref:RNA polymerase alpha subunit C-terminal domain-containing protein n=1 Tax=Pedobacter paludis TaxID=2203212 RepID=A0A317F1Y4_9SPHI|nr:hypothetical protein [Pedobacter paludis]PWS32652.1 hypothetical protein DF947_06155 [Pedobacter paludis]